MITQTNKINQLAGAYCGYAVVGAMLVGWWAIAGFVPPPSPAEGPQQIAERFRDNTTSIRIGLLICLFGAALLLPWFGTLTTQVKRIEGAHAPFTYVQSINGACLTIEFVLPLWFWATAAFRPESSPEFIQRLNDLAWLPFLGASSTTIVQCITLGIIVLQDSRRNPVFPRWFGYFNFWTALAFTPANLILFFHNGPLAWNGIVSFWFVFIAFAAWMLTLSVLLARAVRAQARDDADERIQESGDLGTVHLS